MYDLKYIHNSVQCITFSSSANRSLAVDIISEITLCLLTLKYKGDESRLGQSISCLCVVNVTVHWLCITLLLFSCKLSLASLSVCRVGSDYGLLHDFFFTFRNVKIQQSVCVLSPRDSFM